MLWNRGSVPTKQGAVEIVLGPARPIVATRILASARPESRITMDSSRALAGIVKMQWATLAPGDGVAVQIAYRGNDARVHVRGAPAVIYWSANPRQSHTLVVVSLLAALTTSFIAWFGFPSSPGKGAGEITIALLGLFFWGTVLFYAAGFVQFPPARLRAAIDALYPQYTLWPDGPG